MTVGHALWPDRLEPAERAQLKPGVPEDLERAPDVLVVGGGMLGCATAAACVRSKLGSVVLLERDQLGSGTSGGAKGLLVPESHVGQDPPDLVDLMRSSLEAWRELETAWPGGVSLLPHSWYGQPQGRVNPLRAIARLAAGLPGVATGVDVTGIRTQGGRVHTLETSIGEFRPKAVVFATGLPPRLGGLHLNLPSLEVKGHMLASARTPLRPPDDIADETEVVVEDGRLILGGTLDIDDHERVVRPDAVAAMWNELASRWPSAVEIDVEYQWACFRPAHPNRVPVIDRIPGLNNAWFTSGHYKTGILLAAATGRALAEWIDSDSPPDEIKPFGMARVLAADKD